MEITHTEIKNIFEATATPPPVQCSTHAIPTTTGTSQSHQWGPFAPQWMM